MDEYSFHTCYDCFPHSRAELDEFLNRFERKPITEESFLESQSCEDEIRFIFAKGLTTEIDVNFELFKTINRASSEEINALGKEITNYAIEDLPAHFWSVKDKCGLYRGNPKSSILYLVKLFACSCNHRIAVDYVFE